MLLKYELQANCKWADGRQQNKVYKLPVLTLTLADLLSLSPQPPPPPAPHGSPFVHYLSRPKIFWISQNPHAIIVYCP